MIFLILSAILLSVSTPISIALDNVAIGIGLLGLILIYKRIRLNNMDYIVLGVSATGFISSVLSVNPLLSLKNSHYLWHFIPYFIASRVKREKVYVLINILGLFGIIASFGVILHAFTGVKPTHMLGFGNIHVLSQPIRASGFFSTPLTTAGIVAPIMFIFFGIMLFEKNLKLRIYSFSVFVFMFFALILTSTRSYWLGSVVAVVLLPFIYIKSKKAKLFSFGSILIVILMYVFVPKVHDRVQTAIHYKKDVSAMDRIALWEAGIDLYKNYDIKNKLIGCGSGNVYYYLKPYLIKHVKKIFGDKNVDSHLFSALHNEYLQILIKWGIIGLIVWLFLWIYVLYRNVIFILRTENDFYRAFIVGVTMGFVTFLVGGFFEHNVGDAEVIIFIMYLLGLNKNILDSLKEGAL